MYLINDKDDKETDLKNKINGLISNRSKFNFEKKLIFDKYIYFERFLKGLYFPPFELEWQLSSKCNLNCVFCIGNCLQKKFDSKRLENLTNSNNIGNIVKNIVNFNKDSIRKTGLGIELIKFSGYQGEVLLEKECFLEATNCLVDNGLKFGVFTNGLLMTEEIMDVLKHAEYVHVSIDAGRNTYPVIKGTNDKNAYNTVIENICRLRSIKDRNNSDVSINIGFVVVPGNIFDIFETTKEVKEAGADLIRFKVDISDENRLSETGQNSIEVAFNEIKRARHYFQSNDFDVVEIFDEEQAKKHKYGRFDCKRGCHFARFVTTLGSTGQIFLCDHNTTQNGLALGCLIDESFEDLWQKSTNMKWSENVCRSGVCPPMGYSINAFVENILKLKNEYSTDVVIKAIKDLKNNHFNEKLLKQKERL